MLGRDYGFFFATLICLSSLSLICRHFFFKSMFCNQQVWGVCVLVVNKIGKKKASFRAIRVCYEKCVRKACILTKWRVWGEDWSCVKQLMGACFGLYCFFRFYTSCFSPSLLGFQASNQDIFDFLSLSQCINIPQNIWFSFSRMITCTFLPFSTSSLI